MMFLHFDRTLAYAIWAFANAPGTSRNDMGAALELLIAYILETQGEYEVRHNIRTLDGQIDLLVRNLNASNPVLQELGTYILVEAKKWHRAATTAVVKKFITELSSAGCHSGILVSFEGVTGGRANVNANYTIRKHYHRDNVVVIVLDGDDLQQLINIPGSLNPLLISKYESIRLGEQ
jgi:restriction endonuclease